ncbi:hypothetical protein Ccrd_022277 [Cynara cardunculus var. scolymus]|uniref:Uncharacterized protein n=1 Tax=Cynara cardunculus var. scolymus TaxID=59895 RepID=A0A118JZ43_CYNCS|nr:hypothetical protein Ccrd_022277 [Cynara cardunculus var. scolymus]
MTALEAQLDSVGRVRSRGIDEHETRASKLRRRSQADINAPAFDLGISPSKEDVLACVGSSKAIGGHENVISTMPKRDPKLSFKLRSPYVTRAVTFEVSSDERKLQDWILRGIGGTFEPVFMTTKGKTVTRQTMQSLISQSGMDAIIRDEDLNVNQRYDRFRKNITSCMNNDKELINMRNVDLVFFLVVEPSFYYVLVFDLKRPSVAILDSQNRDGKVDDIYGASTVGLQDMMIMHLLKKGHGAWKVYPEMDQDHIKTRWQFRENTVDAGVILMRHMDTFFGGDVMKWECGLYKEGTKQKRQLKDLRTKYCSKMLLSDENIRKTSIVSDVERFIAMETSYVVRKNRGARLMSRGKK